MKNAKWFIVGIVLLFGIVIALDYFKVKPIDWTPYYLTSKKEPLGLFVVKRELPKILDTTILEFSETPYEYFRKHEYDSVTLKVQTFLHISQYGDIDMQSVKEILAFASHGNTVFLSMGDYSEFLLDTLDLDYGAQRTFRDTLSQKIASDGKMYSYKMYDGFGTMFLKVGSQLRHEILGFQSDKDSVKVNFVRTPFGSGQIYLHTQPAIFSNYHLLKSDHRMLAEKVLSQIPNHPTIWYSPSPIAINATPLRYWLSQPALKYAWFTFLLGAIVFMVFRAKRTQRIVPEIRPLTNTTVEFTKTVANLYLRESDHGAIIDKKIHHFLVKVRSELKLDTEKLDEDFIKKLQQKSGKDYFEVERAVFLIKLHRQKKIGNSEQDLIQLNKALENIL